MIKKPLKSIFVICIISIICTSCASGEKGTSSVLDSLPEYSTNRQELEMSSDVFASEDTNTEYSVEMPEINLPDVDVPNGWERVDFEIEVHEEINNRQNFTGTVWITTVLPDWAKISDDYPRNKHSVYFVYKNQNQNLGHIGNLYKAFDDDSLLNQVETVSKDVLEMKIGNKDVIREVYLTPPKGDENFYYYQYFFIDKGTLIHLSFTIKGYDNPTDLAIHETIISSMLITIGQENP